MTGATRLTSLDDPRAAPFRNVRERDLRTEGLFLAEGALLAQRVLESRFPLVSVLVAEECRAEFEPQVLAGVPVHMAPAALMRQVVGFDFHRGVLALARRLPLPTPTELVESALASAPEGARLRLVACPETSTDENVGLVVRSARAFGVGGLLLPEGGADPLSRRGLRQSMGGSLELPLARSGDLLGEVRALKGRHGLQVVAAVASPEAQSLGDFVWPERALLAVGHEFRGLDEEWLGECDFHVTIPVAPGCDSLNVAVATGIFLHHMASAASST